MFDITQFRQWIVRPALADLQLQSAAFEELLIFTCAVESNGGTYVHQIQGPALGIYQIEPNTFTDLWANYIIRTPNVVNLLSLNFGLNRVPQPMEIITNLRLATALCALYYSWKKANPNSTDANYLWNLYQSLYNTELGAAQMDESIALYQRFSSVALGT